MGILESQLSVQTLSAIPQLTVKILADSQYQLSF